MKRIGSMVIVLIFIASLAWGVESFHASGQVHGQNLIRASRDALIDQKYVRAENQLQQNINVNPDHRDARLLLSRIHDYLSGNYYLKNGQLGLAVIKYRKASQSSSTVLHKRGWQRIYLINRIERKAIRYNRIYNQAIVDNHQKKFKVSNRELDPLVADSWLRLNYFKTLKLLINRLRQDNGSSSLSSQVERNCFPELSLSVQSEKPVVNYGVTEARKEIKQAGINVNKMNSRMILNIIKQARRHHVSIYRYAKKNY